jgi:hypothetical protein
VHSTLQKKIRWASFGGFFFYKILHLPTFITKNKLAKLLLTSRQARRVFLQ